MTKALHLQEVLDLDLLTLQAHTEQAGDRLDAARWRETLAQSLAVSEVAVVRRGIVRLQSHVYKTNRLSMAFHALLGFAITRENDKGVEFTASVADLVAAAAGKMGASLPARCP